MEPDEMLARGALKLRIGALELREGALKLRDGALKVLPPKDCARPLTPALGIYLDEGL